MRLLLIVVVSLVAGGWPGLAQTSYSITYTGRTFGYARVPDVQRQAANHCNSGSVDLPQVRSLLEQIQHGGQGGLLVSLGDNFSPDLNARSIQMDGHPAPKDQLVFDYLGTRSWVPFDNTTPQLDNSLANGEGVLDFDNVGCFLRLAGFDAIVPGQHDFHFGPERLRQLARYLADPAGGGKAVEMLAANLAISTSVVEPPAQTEPAPKPENYGYNAPGGVQFSLPAVPLPYLREFPLQKGIQTQSPNPGELQSRAGGVSKVLYPHGWICRGDLKPHFDPSGCEELAAKSSTATDTTLHFQLPLDKFPLYPDPAAVQPGVNYFVCASQVTAADQMSAKNTVCHAAFEFHYPLLQWGKAAQPNPKLYVIRGPVVLFGVVDPELQGEIGALKESWLNGDARFDTRLEITDPHDALIQLLQTCEQDPACAGKRHVLLAQMPAERAQHLAAHLRSEDGVDLVIAQADDGSATGDLSRVDRVQADEKLKPLVLVPGHAVNVGTGELKMQLATARIEDQANARTVENRLTKFTAKQAEEQYSGQIPLWEMMVRAHLVPRPKDEKSIDPASIVENGILNVMRTYCKADVAFLQRRDLFRPDFYAKAQPAPGELQPLLDRLLWKGDFISCRPANGAALKQVKAASDQFSAQNELAEAGESGRSVEVLGMFPDPSSGLVVNGAVVQDLSLYAIATTDYLAEGETGYPTIAITAAASRKDVLEADSFDEITALICRRLIRTEPDGSGKGYCRGTLPAESYLDPIALLPYALPKGLTEGGKLREWASENWKTKNILAPVQGNPTELNAQNHRVFSVRLDKADLGFQENLHSLSETLQQQRFGGVQAPQPTAPERYDWTADLLLRVTSYGKNVDRFMQADAEYESSGVKQVFTNVSPNGTITTSEPFQRSLPRNSGGAEIGLETRLFPRHQKNVTGIRLLTSARYETELTAPFVQFQAADGFFNETLPRRNALLGKAGLRYDGARSWFEIGMQTGPDTEIRQLKLGSLSCDPGNVQGCLTANGVLPAVAQSEGLPFSVTTARREQSGAFFNARIHLPLLYKKLDYTIDNSGTLLFNRSGDSSADTHYLEVMTHSLVIPVIGNLSIAPRVDLFFFQNKVSGFHIHGYQTTISAQYRFDWHTGLVWKDVLRYPSPPPAQ